MAIKKKGTYTDIELTWAESQLRTWRDYVDAHPISELEDRVEWKQTKTGGTMPMVVATIEQQGKFIQETMKNYLLLLREVEQMREKEEGKRSSPRGDNSLSPLESGEI